MDRKPTYEDLEQRVKALENAASRSKRVEERLRIGNGMEWVSDALFYKAFSMSPIPTAITGISDGKVVKVNEAFERLTGYRAHEIKGQPMAQLNIWGNPEDRNRIVNDLLEKSSIKNVELPVRTRSREIRVCVFSAEIIELDERQYMAAVLRKGTFGWI